MSYYLVVHTGPGDASNPTSFETAVCRSGRMGVRMVGGEGRGEAGEEEDLTCVFWRHGFGQQVSGHSAAPDRCYR